MRLLASLLLFAFVFEACSSPTPPASAFISAIEPLSLSGGPGSFATFALPTLGSENGNAISPLFELPAIATNQGTLGLMMWGAENGSDGITAITQAEVLGLGPAGTSTAHIFFNTASQPVLFVDDTSGYSIAVTNVTSTQATVTLCDPDGAADVSTVVSNANGNAGIGPVTTGGSCALADLNLAKVTRPTAMDSSGATSLSNLQSLAQLITAGSYVAGFSFALGAILKFKEHKVNPTQIPVSMPIALLFIAGALIFIPTIFPSNPTVFQDGSLVAVNGVVPSYEPSAP